MSGWKQCQNGNNSFVSIGRLRVIFFLFCTVLQFFWNVVHIMETMFPPSPSAGIKWGNYCEVPFLCFFSLQNPIVSFRPCPESERMGLGWILSFTGGAPRARLSPVFSCPPTMSTLSHKWNALDNPVGLILGIPGTCKAKTSISLP